ncbi:MAG: hypothetical protein A4E44_01034 [Methanosaeta sp. PtaB.Bin018]|nr:MAG: hypothetical protein A4E44_01034 [Methanosaeta sp. PtaB.Bin018]OPY43570.1 MAG: hypothetical protein A4E46_01771 [Methanosaeta sp. PtaU1.Bin016]
MEIELHPAASLLEETFNVLISPAELLAGALKQSSREATVLLYAHALDPQLQKMAELADRMFCFYEEQSGGQKAEVRMPGAQAMLEAYS